mgnify:CR=1 FL=1
MLQNPYNMSKCLTKQSGKRIVQINNKEKLGVYYFLWKKVFSRSLLDVMNLIHSVRITQKNQSNMVKRKVRKELKN